MNKLTFTFLLAALTTVGASAQFIDQTADRVKTPLTLSWKRIGTLKPRSTKDIASSRITVGCETLDRDYTDFDAYKDVPASTGGQENTSSGGLGQVRKSKGCL